MKPRYLLLPLLLLSVSLGYQQVTTFRHQREHLLRLEHESTRYAYLIEKVMYDEAGLHRELEDKLGALARLRGQLPASLQYEEEERRIITAAGLQGVKILAMKSALYSRPLYREAQIGLTVEADAAAIDRFLGSLADSPRLMHLTLTSPPGTRKAELSISLFAVDPGVLEAPPLLPCEEIGDGLWFPPLRAALSEHVAAYREKCHFVSNYGDVYQRKVRLHLVQEEVSRLQAVAAELESGATGK